MSNEFNKALKNIPLEAKKRVAKEIEAIDRQVKTKTYEVYYKKDKEDIEDVVVQTKECIRPTMLQSYKNLEKMFDRGNLFSFGYRQIK